MSMQLYLVIFLTLSQANCSIIAHRIASNNVTLRASIPADRTYYIAAVDIDWDYAPNASNPFTGIPVHNDSGASVYTLPGVDRIGSIYQKAVYREYTDNTFSSMKEYDSTWQHLGVLGPPIRAIVGERIKIHFKNLASRNYSMHPHGVSYNKWSEGALYQRKFGDRSFLKPITDASHTGFNVVTPGMEWVYIWDARDNSAGSEGEYSSKLWWYHSHIHETEDTNTGLVGPIIITKPGFARDSESNLMPKDIDREFVTLFTVFDENVGWYLQESLLKFATNFTEADLQDFDFEDEDFAESNLMHSMNGYSWNALGKYYGGIKKGERVRWYIGAMGTEVDIHSAHWHGNIIRKDAFVYEDVVQLMPAYTTTVDMIADNAGQWFYHCHVNDHVEAGMIATYTVLNETCTDCIGDAYVYDDEGDELVDANTSFSGVLADASTWIIVLASFLANAVIFLLVSVICRVCERKKGGKRYQTVDNDELKKGILELE
eukprot:CAMPEP_0197024124 /NCGR_PEP_ID=MMETSP1384-20130603/4759_1 /TAXON_ID=29189 /ORGANISM="Ammonia sp." /LENGTH=487 /DNA_ID=CAMNT_0042452465 /DNA_START=74 /DNA_END=1537 /DNA_ORIENTATION=-